MLALVERIVTPEKEKRGMRLVQFYNGIENILKRISHFHSVHLPSSETWHIELFQRFAFPPHPGLPQLFDSELATALAPYRRFRHVAFHSYGFQLDWSRMSEGIKNVEIVFNQIQGSLSVYLNSINK